MEIPNNISMIMPIERPNDFNNVKIEPSENSCSYFVEQVKKWISWFHQFFDIFQYIIEWLRKYHVDGAAELCFAINSSRNKNTILVLEMKKAAEKIMNMLRSIKNLERLCNILNCSVPFKLIEEGTKYDVQDSKKYIKNLKRLNSNNSFVADSQESISQKCSINSHQNVYWSLASENWSCDVNIWFQRVGLSDDPVLLFPGVDIPTDKFVYHGEFETLYPGQLIIELVNRKHNPCSIWYHIKQNNMPVCRLFDGIASLCYADDLAQKERIDISSFIDKLDNKVFPFIDQLLDGKIKLSEMSDLEDIFCGENIHIPYEVTKLFTNRLTNEEQHTTTATPSKQQIDQICKRLQIFQYYSHIKIIVNCIKTFGIISDTDGTSTIDNLEELSDKKQCFLENISRDYSLLTQEFQDISSKHLDLIKTANECSNIIELMKEFDLYSEKGRQKFQELRDNLTIQFQLQELNNVMLNSFIITYALCEPFVLKAKTLKEFVVRIVKLVNFDANSLHHMKGKIIFIVPYTSDRCERHLHHHPLLGTISKYIYLFYSCK